LIFLSIGTQEPFDRLVRAVDDWCGQPGQTRVVFGQIAERHDGGYVPRNFEWVARLSAVDYAARFAQADVIVSHAGMGSIITALHHSKPIVIMPRWAKLHEHRNDHQLATVRMLGGRPGIQVAEDETQLGPVLDRVLAESSGPQAAPIPALADSQFTDALRAFLTGQNVDRK
jgi:UDP-N-acetylglucosamine transferase subunit ALG13